MKCLACNKLIRVKVSWQNLFREKNYYICDNCYLKYPIDITYQVVPLSKNVHVFSLFSCTHNVNPDAFLWELAGLFKFIKEKYDLNEAAFFYFDTFNEMLEHEEMFEYLRDFPDIIVMVTYL